MRLLSGVFGSPHRLLPWVVVTLTADTVLL